jgi:hypothetical protein
MSTGGEQAGRRVGRKVVRKRERIGSDSVKPGGLIGT